MNICRTQWGEHDSEITTTEGKNGTRYSARYMWIHYKGTYLLFVQAGLESFRVNCFFFFNAPLATKFFNHSLVT